MANQTETHQAHYICDEAGVAVETKDAAIAAPDNIEETRKVQYICDEAGVSVQVEVPSSAAPDGEAEVLSTSAPAERGETHSPYKVFDEAGLAVLAGEHESSDKVGTAVPGESAATGGTDFYVCDEAGVAVERGASLPDEAKLKASIASLIKGRALENVRLGQLRRELGSSLGLAPEALDAEPHRSLVNRLAQEVVQEMSEQAEGQNEDTATPVKDGKGKRKAEDGASGHKAKKRPAAVEPANPPMTRSEFLDAADVLPVKIGGTKVQVSKKAFSSACGYHGLARVPVKVGDKEVIMQCLVQCHVVGSQHWPA